MPGEEQLEEMKDVVRKDEEQEDRVTVAESDFQAKFDAFQKELEEQKQKLIEATTPKEDKPSKENTYKKNHRDNQFTIFRGVRPGNKPKVKPPTKKFTDKGVEAVLGERRGAFKIWPDRPVKNT